MCRGLPEVLQKEILTLFLEQGISGVKDVTRAHYEALYEKIDVYKRQVEAVAQVAKCTVCVADRDQIVAAAGPGKKDYTGKTIHLALIHI